MTSTGDGRGEKIVARLIQSLTEVLSGLFRERFMFTTSVWVVCVQISSKQTSSMIGTLLHTICETLQINYQL